MPNQAIKNKGDVKVVAAASVVGVTSEPPAPTPAPVVEAPKPPVRRAFTAPPVAVDPKEPVCEKCKGTHRVIFVEKGRGLKSVGPCECVKA